MRRARVSSSNHGASRFGLIGSHPLHRILTRADVLARSCRARAKRTRGVVVVMVAAVAHVVAGILERPARASPAFSEPTPERTFLHCASFRCHLHGQHSSMKRGLSR